MASILSLSNTAALQTLYYKRVHLIWKDTVCRICCIVADGLNKLVTKQTTGYWLFETLRREWDAIQKIEEEHNNVWSGMAKLTSRKNQQNNPALSA